MPAPVDYNYFTHPDHLQAWIDKAGGLAAVLTMIQLNRVEVVLGADGQYEVYINTTGSWATDGDALSAMIIGILKYYE